MFLVGLGFNVLELISKPLDLQPYEDLKHPGALIPRTFPPLIGLIPRTIPSLGPHFKTEVPVLGSQARGHRPRRQQCGHQLLRSSRFGHQISGFSVLRTSGFRAKTDLGALGFKLGGFELQGLSLGV